MRSFLLAISLFLSVSIFAEQKPARGSYSEVAFFQLMHLPLAHQKPCQVALIILQDGSVFSSIFQDGEPLQLWSQSDPIFILDIDGVNKTLIHGEKNERLPVRYVGRVELPAILNQIQRKVEGSFTLAGSDGWVLEKCFALTIKSWEEGDYVFVFPFSSYYFSDLDLSDPFFERRDDMASILLLNPLKSEYTIAWQKS